MGDTYIVGVGMTPFGRHLEKSVKQLAGWAIEDAMRDAGVQRQQVQTVFFGNCVQGHFEGQHCVRGQVALLPQGFQGIPIFNVESACATGSVALHLAATQLRAGAADVALAVGVEKMYSTEKARMFSAFDSGGTCTKSTRACAC